MTELTIRPRTTDDDQRLLDIFLQFEEVFRFSLEDWRFHMDQRARGDGKQPVMMVGEVNGEIVGDWYVEPHYSGAPGVFFVTIEVDQAKQGKGYGSRLWSHAESHLQERGVQKAYHSISENLERSQIFATKRGFERTGRADRISRLTLTEANLDGYAGIEQRIAEKGVVIRTVNEVSTEDETFMHELYEALTTMLRDIPRSEENWEPDTYDIWRKNFMQWPGVIPDAYFLALRDGHPIGMANLQKSGSRGLLNGLTGVVPEERHKGVARALKFKTIEWAQAGGYEYIDTANDSANEPMLSINIPLGYKPLPAREEWLKTYA